jgi:hypothetical protein
MIDEDGMSVLQSEISGLKSQLDAFNQTSDNAAAIANYQAIIERIGQLPDNLDDHFKRTLLLRHPDLKGDLSLTESEQALFETCAESLKQFDNHWTENDYNARQGNTLEDLSISLEDFSVAIKNTNQSLWHQWTEELRVSFDVEDYLLEAQKGLDIVERRRTAFENTRKRFDGMTKNMPSDDKDIAAVRSLAEDLRNLSSQMEHDIPDAVRVFFEHAADINNGASINLLTPEVIDYLTEKDALENFVVKRSGYRRGY